MTTAKTPNYTPEAVAKMLTEYTAAPTKETVEALADALGKSVKQVTAKLVNLGIYKKPERLTKTGEPVQKKDETATAIGAVLGLAEADTDSLAKANKRALQAIFKALANSKPLDGN